VALSGELIFVGTENSVSLSVANWAIFRPSETENNIELFTPHFNCVHLLLPPNFLSYILTWNYWTE